MSVGASRWIDRTIDRITRQTDRQFSKPIICLANRLLFCISDSPGTDYLSVDNGNGDYTHSIGKYINMFTSIKLVIVYYVSF